MNWRLVVYADLNAVRDGVISTVVSETMSNLLETGTRVLLRDPSTADDWLVGVVTSTQRGISGRPVATFKVAL